jgi:hypothetical protein
MGLQILHYYLNIFLLEGGRELASVGSLAHEPNVTSNGGNNQGCIRVWYTYIWWLRGNIFLLKCFVSRSAYYCTFVLAIVYCFSFRGFYPLLSSGVWLSLYGHFINVADSGYGFTFFAVRGSLVTLGSIMVSLLDSIHIVLGSGIRPALDLFTDYRN